jgi:hypothetical protein
VSEGEFEDKVPPELAKLLGVVQDSMRQSRSDSIGGTRLELASRIFLFLADRFMRKPTFDAKLVVTAVRYADELMRSLRKPSEGS